ncbi:hypothetical protein Rt10032_c05g2220 [Rhodotorula toruloides]|uniref:Uncharacterized protein n=1 Tax=Rhodotorula toruloides TaxID=5286 RepID=A0A511KCV6_RHOTO|nr:hypothetical protein Rt10032_c05g2220 [Rhodotorula toruloides]
MKNEGLFAADAKVLPSLHFLLPPLVLIDASHLNDVLPAEVYLGLSYPTIFTCSPNESRYSRYLKDPLARVFAFDPIYRHEFNRFLTSCPASANRFLPRTFAASPDPSVPPSTAASPPVTAHNSMLLADASAGQRKWGAESVCSIRLELLPTRLPLLPRVEAYWTARAQSSDLHSPVEVFQSIGPTFRDVFDVSKTTGKLEADIFGSQILAGPISELAQV